MTHAKHASAHEHRGLAFLLAGLSAIGPFATDTYLPSLQEIGHTLGASPALVQQTLTAYMVPFAAMTLWQGAISDALGRRKVILALLAVFFAASIGCMFAWDITSLMAFRALQGMSAGAGMVIGRAIVRDLFDGVEARRMMAQVAITFAVAPAIGPVIGGWLHVWFGWRSVFAFMALFCAALWVWTWKSLPESLPHHHRQPLDVRHLVRSYWKVGCTPRFVALVLAVTLNFSAVFLYIVSAPAFLMGHLHVDETGFLWLFGPITFGILTGTWLSGRLATRLSNARTIALGYALMGIAATANLAFHLLHAPALPWSVVPIALYVVGSSVATPSLTLLALDMFPRMRGMASSCQSFVQSSGNAIVTAVLAPLFWGSALSLATGHIIIMCLGMISFLAYRLLGRGPATTNQG